MTQFVAQYTKQKNNIKYDCGGHCESSRKLINRYFVCLSAHGTSNSFSIFICYIIFFSSRFIITAVPCLFEKYGKSKKKCLSHDEIVNYNLDTNDYRTQR